MKIEAKTKDVLTAAQFAQGALKTRTPLMILSHLMVNPGDGMISFSGSDIEMVVTARCKCSVEGSEPFCIPARLFVDTLAMSPAEKVVISTENGRARLALEKRNSVISTLEPDQFPKFAMTGNNQFTISSGLLAESIEKVLPSVMADAIQRPILAGIHFWRHGGHLDITATNGKSLGTVRIPMDGESEFILPSSACEMVLRAASQSDCSAVVRFSENAARFDFADFSVTSKLVEGTYPEWSKLTKPSIKASFKCDRKKLISAVKCASLYTNDATFGVMFEVKDGHVEVSTQNAMNGITETIPVEATGPMKFKLDQKYFLPMVECMDVETVDIGELSDSEAIRVEEGNFYGITMKMRV